MGDGRVFPFFTIQFVISNVFIHAKVTWEHVVFSFRSLFQMKGISKGRAQRTRGEERNLLGVYKSQILQIK